MANSDLGIKQWDLVVVPFPYSDKLAEKRRPALVISSDKFNAETGLLWVAMITSTENIGWNGDVEIPVAAKSSLTTPSTIRSAKLATIEQSRVVRVIGNIDKRTSNKVKRYLLETIV
jgi:mRNA interferase MazF